MNAAHKTSHGTKTRFALALVVFFSLPLCFSCSIATLSQIKAAVKDGYVSGYMQKGIDEARLKKLRKQKKWLPYVMDCAKGTPQAAPFGVKEPCRLGDALEKKFLTLLNSCSIANWFKRKITTIPKVLQDNLALERKIKNFEGVSVFRLFRFVFLKAQIQEFARDRSQTRRFLKRNVLGSNLHLSSARGFNSASYRQTCNSLVQAGLKMGINFSLIDLKSALQSQYNTQGFRELLVFQGVFTSPLHKALELPDSDPSKWFTRLHVWLAYKRLIKKPSKQNASLKYLKSLVGVATFETQRSSRKTQLNSSTSGKGDVKFLSGSANIKAKYVGNQSFDFKGFSTLVFQQRGGSRWNAEFDDLPNPRQIRDELKTKNFPTSPSLTFLVPKSEYQQLLSVEGMPVELCKQSAWKLLDCEHKYKGFLGKVKRKRCGSPKNKRWISKIRLEEVEFTKRSEQQSSPSCQFKVSYKTLQPKGLKERYNLKYVLVGRNQARIGDTALLIPHESEFDLNAHPQLRVDKSLSSLKPEFVDSGERGASLRWTIPIEVEDGKNRITKVKKPENFTIICHGKRKTEDRKLLDLKERPRRLELAFSLLLDYSEKLRMVNGKWDPDACTLEFTVKLLVEESSRSSRRSRKSRRRKRRRRRRRSDSNEKSGKVREVERIIRTHFLYPVFEANADLASKEPASFSKPKSNGTKPTTPTTNKPTPAPKPQSKQPKK